MYRFKEFLLFSFFGCLLAAPIPSSIQTAGSQNEEDSSALDEIINVNLEANLLTGDDKTNLFDGDMILLDGMKDMYDRSDKPTHERKRRELQQDQYLWPNGELVYDFEAGFPAQSIVLEAMAEIEANVECVRFRRKTASDRTYALIKYGNGCWSTVGTAGGQTEISLGWRCDTKKTATHELLHALGMHHEHQRSDRDDYIDIHWDKIKPGFDYAFHQILWKFHRPMGYDYDYMSIMHYGTNAFSRGWGSDWKTISRKGNPSGSLGGQEMSPTDIGQLRALYGCDGTDESSIIIEATVAATTTEPSTTPRTTPPPTTTTTPPPTTTTPPPTTTTPQPTTTTTPAPTTTTPQPTTTTTPPPTTTTLPPTTTTTPAPTTTPTTTPPPTTTTPPPTTTATTTPPPTTTRATTEPATTKRTTTSSSDDDQDDKIVCEDKHYYCYMWTYLGYCISGPYQDYMRSACASSCRVSHCL